MGADFSAEWESGAMGMEGRSCGSLPGPKTQLLEGKLSGSSILHRGWGSAFQGLSSPLALTKSCLVSPQLQARLTITARVSDGVNNEVSAGARAGWLRWEGSRVPARAVDKAQWQGNWKWVGDAGWLARVGMRCQNCTQLCWPPSHTPILCPL